MELQRTNVSAEDARGAAVVGRERKCSVSGCQARHYAKEFCKKHYTQVLRHGKLTPNRERGVVRTCKVDGCERTDTIQWYCRKHARQLRIHGRLTPEREHLTGFEGCRVARCDQPHRAKGYCAKHYNTARWERIKGSRARGSSAVHGKDRRAEASSRRAPTAQGGRRTKRPKR